MKHRIERPRGIPLARTLAETLMFPTVLFLAILFCFPTAFHEPQPNHAKVVVANRTLETKVDAALQQKHPDWFDVSAVADAGEARQAVLNRDAVAGYVAEGRHAVLYVAEANGLPLRQALTKGFTRLAAHNHQRLTVTDVAPTVSKDLNAATLVYFGVAWSVPGYILATTLLRAVTFNRRKKLMMIVGASALFSAVGFFVGVGLDYFPNDPSVLAIALLLTTAVATFAHGVAPFTKQFFPMVGMGLYIVLSIPSSGVAPVPLLPTFFQDLHVVMPLGNAVDALKGVLYFDNAGVLTPVLVLCAWITAGLALMGLDAWRHHRLAARSGAEDEQEDIPEPPVEDPSVEAPTPTALPVHRHHFGEPLPMLEGTVRNDEQQPVRHAAVTVMDTSGRQLVRTTTNAQGEYAVTGLPEGYISVVVSYPGRNPVVHQKLLQSGVAVRADFSMHERRNGASPNLLSNGTGPTTIRGEAARGCR
ncbi:MULTISPECIES: carboxypeptidase regulatory-like domain-containing protein [unclassified Streptomyces]|uniref:carboxypeptidase regulatory-like domain-containing protein n=1 Tax=unclassified Streptomyces TaxID=2593676 RepID=UPI002E807719|nr:carboxypeptidase regulatory-like domain-containing protein [Streptomyces sp. NBC_00562]WTC83784.1 carboxypeptidase regulatory-like domain-containing protein [Streptomyces sp. NBC_01653]WTD31566.1 carboxypeptidase regulatory-like domain-containing protein [Streptomyces sp. NBC_01643]WTD87082.1 carboxypeptidase regulatory-like domain-containing protein [Streptomyces sp. NBC_01637]WUC18167.1 carboxypeptidase regulatory-like domain-containing protein [Streptomyces sp. NBC_00562]